MSRWNFAKWWIAPKIFPGRGDMWQKARGGVAERAAPPLCPTGKHGRIKAQDTCKKNGGAGGNLGFPPCNPDVVALEGPAR